MSLIAGTIISNRFIDSSITDWVSITPEIRVVTHWEIVTETSRIFLIGAGLAMLAGGLTGVLTQVRIQDHWLYLFR